MEVEQRNMKEDLEEVKNQDLIQNRLLDDHIRGVKTQALRLDNEIMYREEIQKRVEALEEAPKFLKTLKKVLMYIAAVGGASAIIFKWFNH